MGFFDGLNRLGRHVERHSERSDANRGVRAVGRQGKTYRMISTAVILGLFFDAGLLTLGIMEGWFVAAPFMILLLSIIGILCMTAALSLIWIRHLERKELKTLSFVMLGILGFAAILWIAIASVIYSMIRNPEGNPLVKLNFIRIGLILSFQVVEAIFISSTWARYRNNYLVFQIIMYISNLFVDFWCSLLFAAIGLKDGNVVLREGVTKLIFSHGMIVMLVLFVVYVIISNSILKTIEDRRMRQVRYDLTQATEAADYEATADADETPVVATDTTEAKLEKIKDLYDKKLITEEEYNAKKAKILEEM